jgi:hypothetical protein
MMMMLMLIVITGHECIWGTVWEVRSAGGGGEKKDTEE